MSLPSPATEVASRVAEGAFMDFGRAHHQLAQPGSESPRSHVHQAPRHRRGLVPGRQRRRPDQARRETPRQTSTARLDKTRLHPAQGLLRHGTEAQTLATCPGAQDEGLPGLVGSPEADRQMPPPHTRNQAQCHPSDDQHPHPEIQSARNRGPEHRRNDGWTNSQGPGRRRHGRNTSRAGIQGTMATGAPHTGPPPIPQQQAVQFMPVPQRETQAGKTPGLPSLRNQTRTKRQRSYEPENTGAPRLGANAPRWEGSGRHATYR